jgi:hypothetical protein
MSDNEHNEDVEMLDEYDFSGGVRGKYADRFTDGSNVIVLEPDVAEIFPDSDSVNRILRTLIPVIQEQAEKVTH